MSTDTLQAARFAQQIMATALPPAAATRIRDLVIDQVGLQLGNGTGLRGEVAPEQAVFVHAAAGRHAGADDYCPVTGAPVGAVVVSTGLTLAPAQGASGGEMARAMVAGAELMLRAAAGGGGGVAVGAAVTAGLLLDLDTNQLADAIALADTMRSALNSYDKRSVAGGAAAGILAASLAAVVRSKPVPPRSCDWNPGWPGEPLLIEAQALRKYACPPSVHAAVDALLVLLGEHSVPPSAITRVQVGVGRRALATMGERAVQAAMAQMLSDGDISRWTSVIDVYDDGLCTAQEVRGGGAVVTLLLADGGELRLRTPHARGTVENPMTDHELRAKFLGHAIPEIGFDRAGALDALLLHLHELSDLDGVTELLGGARRGDYVTA